MIESGYAPGTLRAELDYEPKELQFGTSGRRGDVVDLTQLEIVINAVAEIEYLQSLPKSDGGVSRGDKLYFGYDLRPSSTMLVRVEQGRGEIAQAVEFAVHAAGMIPVNVGRIPTPALLAYARPRGCAGIMITGSHIPFSRNGYKTNTSIGELLKTHESPIAERVVGVRDRFYRELLSDSAFDSRGMLKGGHRELSRESPATRDGYMQRYTSFFDGLGLDGMRILVYQHSAVGRDMLGELLAGFGATVIVDGRSETFVPIDTENIDEAQLAVIESLVAKASQSGPVDAVVSTDGDSDRPLLLGIEDGSPRFYGGDLVGMVVAKYLSADAVVVPISCNDGIDIGALRDRLQPKTRIGSPHVIAGMTAATAKGYRSVCGWEANGGFLTGSDISLRGRLLPALPTRDAFLPILAVLFAAKQAGTTMNNLFAQLPRRYSKAALLKRFERALSHEIVRQFSPSRPEIADVSFSDGEVIATNSNGAAISIDEKERNRLTDIAQILRLVFGDEHGFGDVQGINYIDGVRIRFDNGDIAHVRPSGNADELRIYAVSNTASRAEEIAAVGIREPDGLLRSLAKSVE